MDHFAVDLDAITEALRGIDFEAGMMVWPHSNMRKYHSDFVVLEELDPTVASLKISIRDS